MNVRFTGREMMARIRRENRRDFTRRLKQLVRPRCECGYVFRDFHSLYKGSYFKCKNGHVASWEALMLVLMREMFPSELKFLGIE